MDLELVAGALDRRVVPAVMEDECHVDAALGRDSREHGDKQVNHGSSLVAVPAGAGADQGQRKEWDVAPAVGPKLLAAASHRLGHPCHQLVGFERVMFRSGRDDLDVRVVDHTD